MGETGARRPGRVLAGATSWADRSLVRSGAFYPRKTMTASARLAHYCSRLPLAEAATTYRFPPTPEVTAQWAERTPEGFTLDVRAWSLLTGCPTLPDSLWPDLAGQVHARDVGKRRLYPQHLPDEVLEECWARFDHALEPLRRAGRLGVVTLRYPRWVGPKEEAFASLAALRRRLPGTALAVELASPAWFEDEQCEITLGWLEANGVGLVCVDGPADGERAVPRVVAATADVAVVRFLGRRCVEGEPWTWPYRYHRDELAAWLSDLADLASSCREVHLLFDNTWQGDAVDAALAVLDLAAADDRMAVAATGPAELPLASGDAGRP
jgi:uncharacterized protein YecE (DUF72 family)